MKVILQSNYGYVVIAQAIGRMDLNRSNKEPCLEVAELGFGVRIWRRIGPPICALYSRKLAFNCHQP